MKNDGVLHCFVLLYYALDQARCGPYHSAASSMRFSSLTLLGLHIMLYLQKAGQSLCRHVVQVVVR
jgi:hypothetical protein